MALPPPVRPPLPPWLARLEFIMKEPEKLEAESTMLMLNVLVLFRSVKPYWLGDGLVETELAR